MPVTAAWATSVIAPEFGKLVAQSDYIVRAVVKTVRSELKTDGTQKHIITLVELDVREVISGAPPQPLVLQMLGGKVGSEEMVVEGAPKFKVGDEDILFVHGNGRQLNPLVALMYGRYPIKREAGTNREYMARSNGAPLRSTAEVSRPLGAAGSTQAAAIAGSAAGLSPVEFVGQIKAAINLGSRPKSEH